MVRVLFFGRLADAAGRRRETALEKGDTPEALLRRLAGEDRVLADALLRTHVKFAVNDVIVGGDTALAEGDVVAVLPPFSGG